MMGSAALSNKGLTVPAPLFGPGAWALPAGLAVAIVASLIINRWARARQVATRLRAGAIMVQGASLSCGGDALSA